MWASGVSFSIPSSSQMGFLLPLFLFSPLFLLLLLFLIILLPPPPLLFFETGSYVRPSCCPQTHYVAKGDLKLLILLPLSSKCRCYRHAAPCTYGHCLPLPIVVSFRLWGFAVARAFFPGWPGVLDRRKMKVVWGFINHRFCILTFSVRPSLG